MQTNIITNSHAMMRMNGGDGELLDMLLSSTASLRIRAEATMDHARTVSEQRRNEAAEELEKMAASHEAERLERLLHFDENEAVKCAKRKRAELHMQCAHRP